MGIFGKLFGRDKEASSTSPTPEKIDVERVVEGAYVVIRAMGKFIETNSPGPMCVADEKKLPFPKERIRQAIIIALLTKPNPKEKELLKYLYLEIASWQPSVGEKDVGFDDSLLDMSKLNTNEALIAHAKLVSEEGDKFNKWAPLIEKERSEAQQTL